MLWVGRGRGREDVQPFFKLLGAQGCGQVQAVVMDMNTAYELEVRALPQRRWCDLSCGGKYGREVVDRVVSMRTKKKPRANAGLFSVRCREVSA